MTVHALPLHDEARGRVLATTLHVPDGIDGRLPLVVFGHGFNGHPRRFPKLLGAWAEAGYVVAAPAFPHTNCDTPGGVVFADVAEQPRDVAFVIDELLRLDETAAIVDPTRIGVGGFSLGGVTALAVGFNPAYRTRVRGRSSSSPAASPRTSAGRMRWTRSRS